MAAWKNHRDDDGYADSDADSYVDLYADADSYYDVTSVEVVMNVVVEVRLVLLLVLVPFSMLPLVPQPLDRCSSCRRILVAAKMGIVH